MAKLWGGRFKKKTDPAFEAFSASYRWDWRLLPYELEVDKAHVRGLGRAGVLKPAEVRRLTAALSGALRLNPNAEDVHTAVHEAVAKKTGALADKMHTGRSRNELVSQSTRLYCKDHAGRLIAAVRELQRALVRVAAKNQGVIVADRTHLQKAQVAAAAHLFLAWVEMLERAVEALELARRQADVCVLGSGAVAGSTFALDVKKMARELGLARVAGNSHDVAGDRDFVLTLLFAIEVAGLQLSRVSEDILIDQSRAVSWIDVPAEFCTGSSMMPQKKNPDLVELARGAAAVFSANRHGVYALEKGLPTSYQRDLQWDKKFLFDSVETAEELFAVFASMASGLGVDAERAGKQIDDTLYATDLADYLVGKGVPFKSAHEQVGRLITLSEETARPLSKIGLDLIRQIAPAAGGDVYDLFDPAHSVRMKKTEPSTHPARVAAQIAAWNKKLRK